MAVIFASFKDGKNKFLCWFFKTPSGKVTTTWSAENCRCWLDAVRQETSTLFLEPFWFHLMLTTSCSYLMISDGRDFINELISSERDPFIWVLSSPIFSYPDKTLASASDWTPSHSRQAWQSISKSDAKRDFCKFIFLRMYFSHLSWRNVKMLSNGIVVVSAASNIS